MDKLLIAPITKIDREKREVWGYATLEVPDKTTPVPDVVDYASAVKAFNGWVGNIREMHLPVAVGKAVEIQPDEAKRGIYIGARISKSRDGEDAWTKIQEGVLTAFSIGPKGIRRKPEVWPGTGTGTGTGTEKGTTVNRLFIESLAEVSLVDNPACPGTFFDVAKAVAPEAAEPESSDAKRDMDPNVGGGVDRDKIPAQDFVDPERRRFPIVTAADVMDAVHSFGRAKPKIPFATFKRRLTAIAKRKGFESALPEEWKLVMADSVRKFESSNVRKFLEEKCQACDVQAALQILAGIAMLLDSETMDQMTGAEGAEDVDVLLEAFERVHEFIGQEMAEMMAARAPLEGGATAGPEGYTQTAAEVKEVKSEPQSSVLSPESSSAEAFKALLADAVKDLAGKVDLAPLSEGLGKVEAAVDGLKGRVEKLEQSPAPGGPVLRTQDLGAVGLKAAEKGGAPAQGEQARAVLAEIAKAIDAETNAMAKEKLGQLYGQLCLKLGIR